MKSFGTTLLAVQKKLRAINVPVRLFGEKEDAVFLRLIGIERMRMEEGADEFALGKDNVRNAEGEGFAKPYTPGGEEIGDKRNEGGEKEDKEKDDYMDGDFKDDPHKEIYSYFKGLLKQWSSELSARPEAVARTAAGKTELKTQKQCKDYIKPLFKACKSRTLDDGQVFGILKIVKFCKDGEFVLANDQYIDIAIGRAAWPIGVTMVGIHARAGREKINDNKVAHVMNSELQRKYLTSVKRLMTYAQDKRKDVNPSKKVR
ncbi:hypothetical protein TrRE_jg13165 [Triparma retinervis]|jgi:pre-mRNA-splicing factor 18|uniref:Pre-mRNA-splicing factor 18 n=1 Tax=Triparma retinervis TaxID=2557542 RepID=A0A9W7G154_9STRA|nr:hypothetical protein TrRE_jg13165 [Triparma retinervis]